jgi:antitoxin (DNA-binding transcriptional repressor) of toxin-antitoxin stability system
MRQVSLREFRTRGSSALETVPEGETVLLAGQQGPAYFLIPVSGDVVAQERELRRAMAKGSLRRSWLLSRSSKANVVTDEEIDQEIAAVRAARSSTSPRKKRMSR